MIYAKRSRADLCVGSGYRREWRGHGPEGLPPKIAIFFGFFCCYGVSYCAIETQRRTVSTVADIDKGPNHRYRSLYPSGWPAVVRITRWRPPWSERRWRRNEKEGIRLRAEENPRRQYSHVAGSHSKIFYLVTNKNESNKRGGIALVFSLFESESTTSVDQMDEIRFFAYFNSNTWQIRH